MGRNLAPYSAEEVIKNSAKLTDAFRKKELPVFLVHVKPGEKDRLKVKSDESLGGGKGFGKMPDDWSDFVPELNKKETDIIITKKQWGAFYGTELDLQLRRRKIDTIVLCGIATNYGVESTARFAYEYGYNQIFPEDAMSSMTKEMHDASVNFALKRMGLVRTTKDVLENLK
jgi:nicotinamidase-related amidase